MPKRIKAAILSETCAAGVTFDRLPFVMTQEEVAREMGISQPTVYRLEQSAMRKLRADPAARDLLGFLAAQH